MERLDGRKNSESTGRGHLPGQTKRKSSKAQQLDMLPNRKSAYGGDLMKKRAGRTHGRPLSTKHTMHLTLRSSKAIGDWSFRNFEKDIQKITKKFAVKYGVKVHSLANVGNHLHFHVKLHKAHLYRSFIRAITSAIAMKVTGASRWQRVARESDGDRQLEAVYNQEEIREINKGQRLQFWDYRPFTSIVETLKYFLNLKDYMRVNQLEGFGVKRRDARFLVKAGVFPGLEFESG